MSGMPVFYLVEFCRSGILKGPMSEVVGPAPWTLAARAPGMECGDLHQIWPAAS